jgi:hypothetical protein
MSGRNLTGGEFLVAAGVLFVVGNLFGFVLSVSGLILVGRGITWAYWGCQSKGRLPE